VLCPCCEFRYRTVFSATIIWRSCKRDISSHRFVVSADKTINVNALSVRREFLMSYYIVCRQRMEDDRLHRRLRDKLENDKHSQLNVFYLRYQFILLIIGLNAGLYSVGTILLFLYLWSLECFIDSMYLCVLCKWVWPLWLIASLLPTCFANKCHIKKNFTSDKVTKVTKTTHLTAKDQRQILQILSSKPDSVYMLSIRLFSSVTWNRQKQTEHVIPFARFSKTFRRRLGFQWSRPHA